MLEHYRSLLEGIPGATRVSTGLNPDETGIGILVHTSEAPAQEALDSAPKEQDGAEVRVERVPVAYLTDCVTFGKETGEASRIVAKWLSSRLLVRSRV
jgi:hypothetical protein